jgi:LacI family transcriptional regulator
MLMKRVTINDVAHRAGVSKSTVSHVINQTRIVSLDTRDRVLQAINALDYRPSGIARSLVSQRTKTAGLLISDVGNPFYHDVIMGVEEVALAHGYSIFLCNTGYDSARGMKFIQSLIERSVDGVLFMSSSMQIEMVDDLINRHIHPVVLDWGGAQVQDLAATITIDFSIGLCQAVKHLVDLDHRRIAYVSGPLDFWTSRFRRDAFFAALELNGLDPAQVFVTQGNLRIEGGRRALDELIHATPRPTAVVAANDLTALGILWAARNHGLNIPNDLSIIGLDDIDLVSRVTPPLTTIALPRFEIGKLAMETLLAMVDDRASNTRQVVPTRLVVRSSTARSVSS